MLDAPQMFPNGFHPELQGLKLDISGRAEARRRRSSKGLKYLFIDFGISSSFNSFEQRGKVQGWACQDTTVPELRAGKPYDPFKVDIFVLGNLFRKVICEVSILRLWSRHSEDRQCCRNSPTLTSFGHWPNQ